jgi:hypothetical protein
VPFFFYWIDIKLVKRAGSGLFFIFQTYALAVKVKNPGLVTIQSIFRPQNCQQSLYSTITVPITVNLAVCDKNGIHGYSAGNYHLIDEESTGGMVTLTGITSS